MRAENTANNHSSKMSIKSAVAVYYLLFVSFCVCLRPDPKGYLVYGKQYDDKEYRWIIKRVDSGEWGQSVEKLATNLRFIHKLAEGACLHGVQSIKSQDIFKVSTHDPKRMCWLSSVLDYMVRISSPEPNNAKCNNNVVRAFVGLIDQGFGGLKKFEATLEKPSKSLLFNYLRIHGRKYAQGCLEQVPQFFEAYFKQTERLYPQTEHNLDTLVSMGEQYPPDQKELRLIAQAETLDWAKGKFDAKKTLSAARNLMKAEDLKIWSEPNKPGRSLARFVTKTCGQMRLSFVGGDFFSLARLLVPEAASKVKLSLRTRKFLEYNRLCLPFDLSNTDYSGEINIEKNMKH